MVVLNGQDQLLEIVAAFDATGGLAHFLNRGQQQTDENGNNGNHYQQLDERETPSMRTENHNSFSSALSGIERRRFPLVLWFGFLLRRFRFLPFLAPVLGLFLFLGECEYLNRALPLFI